MNELTLYTTTWCPFCQRLTSDLDAAGVTYVNIDVDEDEAAGVGQIRQRRQPHRPHRQIPRRQPRHQPPRSRCHAQT